MVHRIWVSIFLIQLILFLVEHSAECGPLDSASGNATGEDLLAEFKLARKRNIGVVDARAVVDLNGEQRKDQKEGSWRLNVLPGEPQSPGKRLFALQAHPQVNVIFVHGYNTQPSRDLRYANSLWELLMTSNDRLRSTIKAVPPNESLAFFVFLWRGDLGARRFSLAQKAADISSKSLADFIVKLSAEFPSAKTVVIAHSLGAHVALEALKELCESKKNTVIVDSVVLVEGAVLAISLYKWTVTDILSQRGYVEHNSGRYANDIRCAGHLLYTISEKDTTLLSWFQRDETWIPTPRTPGTLPVMPWSSDPTVGISAIGSPFNTGDKLESIEETRIPDEFGERGKSPEKVGRLSMPKLAALFKFTDWRIDHPNVEALNISEGEEKRPAIVDWHSPIFDEAGLNILENIWKRVLNGFRRSKP